MRKTVAALLVLFLANAAATALSRVGQTDDSVYEIATADPPAEGIVRMRPGESPGRRIANVRASLVPGSWSPDGTKIAAWAGRGLIIVNVDGTGSEQLVENIPVEPFFAWSPDSARLAFSSAFEDPRLNDPRVRQGIEPPSSAIYVLDIRGPAAPSRHRPGPEPLCLLVAGRTSHFVQRL